MIRSGWLEPVGAGQDSSALTSANIRRHIGRWNPWRTTRGSRSQLDVASRRGEAAVAQVEHVSLRLGVDEQRRHQRKKVLWSAKAFLYPDGTSYDCQVRDISDKGAKLRFPETVLVPQRFKLWIIDGGFFVCEPRCVALNWVGTEFVQVLPQSDILKAFGKLV